MFERLRPRKPADANFKAARRLLPRLPELPIIAGLEALHDLLAEGLAQSPDAASARRLVELIAPAAESCAGQGLEALAGAEDNPARRDLTGQRLARLADLLAGACYAEAVRETRALEQGSGRLQELNRLAGGYFQWFGMACTARALLDPHAASQGWQGASQLYLALVRLGALSAQPTRAEQEPARSLAYLLLACDVFPQLDTAKDVAAAVQVCLLLSRHVWLAADFYRQTPLVQLPDALEAQRAVGWDGSGRVEPTLCYGLDDCLPALTALEMPLEPSLLAALRHAWFERANRAPRPAVRKLGHAWLALDFMRIRGLLGQKQARRPANDPFLHRVALLDADEGGVALRMSAEVAAQAKGGLMALEMGSRGWWLAQMTRWQADGVNDVFLAGRWLGQKAEPLRVEVGGLVRQALYLPPASENAYQAALLFDEALPSALRNLLVDLGDGAQNIRLAAAEKLGARLLRYRILAQKQG